MQHTLPPPPDCPAQLLAGQPPLQSKDTVDMYRLLALQHSVGLGPGQLLLDLTSELSFTLKTVRIWQESATDFLDFDALVILGGPPNTDQEELHPYLREEKRIIRAWVSQGKPCLGFCLGHQLLAEAAGATIGPNPNYSMGFIDGHLTHHGRNHPLFKGIPPTLKLFKWHTQEIQTPLPRNMLLLATSQDCMVEAFSLEGRPNIIGLQCDNYLAHPNDIEKLQRDTTNPLTQDTGRPTVQKRLPNQAEALLEDNTQTLRQLIKNFLTMTNKATTQGP